VNYIVRMTGDFYSLGEIGMFGGNFAPRGWLPASGQLLPINQYQAMYSLLGTTYGGDGRTTFALPDLRGRVSIGYGQGAGLPNYTRGTKSGVENTTLFTTQLPIHNHGLPGSRTTLNTGVGQSYTNMQPYLATDYWIATEGLYPSRNLTFDGVEEGEVGEFGAGGIYPFIGEIVQTSSTYLPDHIGFMRAQGQLLPVSEYTALFSLIGTTYGGDGRTTFGLPDLRGRVPVHEGRGDGLTQRRLGERFGQTDVQLTANQIPSHNHHVPPSQSIFTDLTGGSASHTNMQPSLGVNYIVALTGVYPSRNLTYDGLEAPLEGGVEALGNGEPYLGSIAMFGGNFAPRGWAFADGTLLSISQYDALFSLFGTIYGGDGRTTFALPDLRGRAPVHYGTGPGLGSVSIGQEFGVENLTLTPVTMPSHQHNFADVIPGDFDINGRVGVPDLITWAKHFGEGGEGGGAPYEHGDANLDGVVGVPDLIRWAKNLGQVNLLTGGGLEALGVSASAVAIPEPSGLVWGVLACGYWIVGRRRRV
jgi:microcystin-dependent protein